MFLQEISKKKLSIASLNRLIAKDDTTGSANKRNGMVVVCMPRPARTTKNVYGVEAHVLSQED